MLINEPVMPGLSLKRKHTVQEEVTAPAMLRSQGCAGAALHCGGPAPGLGVPPGLLTLMVCDCGGTV